MLGLLSKISLPQSCRMCKMCQEKKCHVADWQCSHWCMSFCYLLQTKLCGTCLNHCEQGMCLYPLPLDKFMPLNFMKTLPCLTICPSHAKHVIFWPCKGHTIVGSLTECIKHFKGLALKHWLNQHPQNSSLQLAAKVKEKVLILKKQSKTEQIDVNVQLWIYLEGKSLACKVWIPSNY